MKNSLIAQVAFILIGLFSMAAAYFNWDWYFEWRNSRWFVNLIGRPAARVFCLVTGVGLVVVGGLAMAGAVELD